MNEIYKQAGDDTLVFVDLWEIREKLGFSDEKMGAITRYLEAEGLITDLVTLTGQMTPKDTNITHEGIREMERSEEHPKEPTDHFPVSVVGNHQHRRQHGRLGDPDGQRRGNPARRGG